MPATVTAPLRNRDATEETGTRLSTEWVPFPPQCLTAHLIPLCKSRILVLARFSGGLKGNR